MTGEDAELVAEAEALHLRSTMHQHAKMLDDALQAQRNLPDVQVRKFAVQVVLALLDEHELMNRRLASRVSALSVELEGAREVLCEMRDLSFGVSGKTGPEINDWFNERARAFLSPNPAPAGRGEP